MRRGSVLRLLLLAAIVGALIAAPRRAEGAPVVFVQAGTPMKYLANQTNPGILGPSWTTEAYKDIAWSTGVYGVGYETAPPGATGLISTAVPAGTYSVYTRATFTVADPSAVTGLLFGADYDDGYIAWINGVEVARSPGMPSGIPNWNSNPSSHESSNAGAPVYSPLVNISAAALPVLHAGTNVLAVGVWNNGAPTSSDLVVVPYLAFDPEGTVTRGPYLQMGTPTGVMVRWRTSTVSVSRVHYGTDPADLSTIAANPGSTTEHLVTLAGLLPSTRYYYAVGTATAILAGDPSYTFVTPPSIGTSVPTRIWVIGDSGTANANAAAVRDAYAGFASGTDTNLWLMLGDNAYESGTDLEFQAAVFDMYPEMLRQSVLWPTLGNHDGITADSATLTGPYYNMFSLPRSGEAGGLPSGTEAYYSFDYANIHFICLDSYETSRAPGGAMLTWLQQDILSTSQPWIIAFWHHPPYTHGSHNSDFEIEHIEMRENALPILEQGGVDLVLGGHSHSYERSFLLDGHYGDSTTFDDTMKKDGGDGRVDGNGPYGKPTPGPAAHEGAVYVVAGSSGQTSGGLLNHPAMYLSLNTLGSLVLDVGGLRLDAGFLDSGGALRDHFTILKGFSTPPTADFTATPTSGVVPLAVQFTDRSTRQPAAWAWDFDDDGTVDSVAQNPTHTYALPGLFSVRLTASNGGGPGATVQPDIVCAISADGLSDADGDAVADGADDCPCDTNAGQADTDQDAIGDACDACPLDPLDDADGDGVCGDQDTCPTVSNPSQDPEPCSLDVEEIVARFGGANLRGTVLVTWSTTHEVDVAHFNVVVVDREGQRVQLNAAPIPCTVCTGGAGSDYAFTFAKRLGMAGIYVEAVRGGGAIETFGPARRFRPSPSPASNHSGN